MTLGRGRSAGASSVHAVRRTHTKSPEDEYFMAVALSLARYGEPAPNPAVGALVVRFGKIVGAGYHERAGEAHAEVVALEDAGALAVGATLYVTLEPCNHFGRTGPCVAAIESARVKRVVVGSADPNPFVRGGGANRLRELGFEVAVGVCAKEAAELLASWRRSLRAYGS